MLDKLIEELEERVTARVLAKLGSVPTSTDYTSKALPRDIPSRARFHVLVRGVPGAVKRGRVWSVPRAAWEES